MRYTRSQIFSNIFTAPRRERLASHYRGCCAPQNLGCSGPRAGSCIALGGGRAAAQAAESAAASRRVGHRATIFPSVPDWRDSHPTTEAAALSKTWAAAAHEPRAAPLSVSRWGESGSPSSRERSSLATRGPPRYHISLRVVPEDAAAPPEQGDSMAAFIQAINVERPPLRMVT
ncbi:hypothetical protein QAD02_020322 [Eretmocerus hayati]|uniref:Uncharacterized protein n=1 Tax=Eretmocerus hayati TaxID=131215 RepID=A0ACC2PM78_9HYME|nr:hypothetical protein QAD02_020322 [Eretmocerus hayati]